MTSPATNVERVKHVLAKYLKRAPESIERSQSLREDLGLDSMATIELLFEIEEVFDLQIPDEDLVTLRTVEDVIGYIDERLGPADLDGA